MSTGTVSTPGVFALNGGNDKDEDGKKAVG